MAWVLTWVVQSLALSAATAALVRLPGFRARASARTAAWRVALVLIVVLACLPWWPAAVSAPATGPAMAAAAPGLIAAAPLVLPVVPRWWQQTGVALWALGALAWLAYAAAQVARVQRLKRACESMTPEEAQRIAPWVAVRAARRAPRFAWCDDLDGPAVLGFRHPVVALPRLHGERLTDAELEHVLLHEIAHVRRRDDWAALAEILLAGLMWVNPAVHIVRRSLALAREMACDDWVVRHTAAPIAYARCLASVADLRRRRGGSSLAAAATGSRSVLARRVTRVLAQSARPSERLARLATMLTPVAVGAVAIALIQMPPVVVEGQPAAAAVATRVSRAPATPGRVPATSLAPTRDEPQAAAPRPARTMISTRRAESVAADGAPAAPPPGAPAEQAVLPPQLLEGATAPAPDPLAESPQLTARPLPGTIVAGPIAVSEPKTSGMIVPEGDRSWWDRATNLGAATGGAAATAGQATASFFKRMGTWVSRPSTR